MVCSKLGRQPINTIPRALHATTDTHWTFLDNDFFLHVDMLGNLESYGKKTYHDKRTSVSTF